MLAATEHITSREQKSKLRCLMIDWCLNRQASYPSIRTDEFILKITVPKLTEKRTEKEQKSDVSEQNRTETEQKPNRNNVKLTEKREAILQLMSDNPYISKAEISKLLGLHPSAVSRNIEAMRGKYLRRVGPDKGGLWEIIL